ncbi:MAG: hypothetical protein ACI379_03520 [Nocardioides sp.]|uniref:hypothetical protein n=1 Tax=Nocardioides sp. TaxID=35761 RepID=UPI003F0DF74A
MPRERMVRQIEAAGMGEWADRFVRDQRTPRTHVAVYTFAEGRFEVAYFEKDEVWHVGWEGPYEVQGHTLEMTDEFSGVTDVYRWRMRDGALDLERVSADAPDVEGMPYEVLDAAYIGDWWQPTDCPMQAGEAC